MMAIEVPTQSCMRTSSGTPRRRKTSNSTGTMTAPPPTPNNPARIPVTTPATRMAAASQTSSVSGTPSAGDVEAEVENRGAVGDPAAGDQIDTGRGDGGGGFESDPPRSFRDGAAVDHRDGPTQGFRVHIVEQHGIDPDLERLGKLIQRVDLDLDLYEVAGMTLRAFQRRAD